MNSPIDPASAAGALIAQATQAAQNTATTPQPSSSPLNLTKAVHVARIETDDMVKCHPKIIRKRNYIIFEKVIVAHLIDNRGTIKITEL